MSKKQRARDEDGVDGEERQKEREREKRERTTRLAELCEERREAKRERKRAIAPSGSGSPLTHARTVNQREPTQRPAHQHTLLRAKLRARAGRQTDLTHRDKKGTQAGTSIEREKERERESTAVGG